MDRSDTFLRIACYGRARRGIVLLGVAVSRCLDTVTDGQGGVRGEE